MKKQRAPDITRLVQAAAWQDYTAVMLGNATQYHLILRVQSGGKMASGDCPTQIPAIINSALAIELYFKCLLQFDDGDFLVTHDLSILFAALSSVRQTQLMFLYNGYVARNPLFAALSAELGRDAVPTIVELVNQNKQAFVSWRYFFENSGLPKPWPNFQPLREACRDLVLQVNPAWMSLFTSFPPPPTFPVH